eukprot:2749608-Amphidinium_carterae.2
MPCCFLGCSDLWGRDILLHVIVRVIGAVFLQWCAPFKNWLSNRRSRTAVHWLKLLDTSVFWVECSSAVSTAVIALEDAGGRPRRRATGGAVYGSVLTEPLALACTSLAPVLLSCVGHPSCALKCASACFIPDARVLRPARLSAAENAAARCAELPA